MEGRLASGWFRAIPACVGAVICYRPRSELAGFAAFGAPTPPALLRRFLYSSTPTLSLVMPKQARSKNVASSAKQAPAET